MADLKIKSDITANFTVILELTLPEAHALYAITQYGSKSFLEGYYKQLGKSYLQPHETGVISLFETIRSNLPKKLSKIQEICDVFQNAKF